jgi:OOP family OmpA-OmpF porin
MHVTFQNALEQIHQEFAKELETFEGDAEPLEPSRKYLEECLLTQYEESHREKEKKLITPMRVIAAILLISILVLGFFYVRSRWRWNNYVARLKSEPGFVITNAERQWGRYSISGLRDPMAADPQVLLGEARLDANNVESRWEPYHSLAPLFVQHRAEALLNPPPTVSFKVRDSVLFASGSASHRWITETRRLVRVMPGLDKMDETNLIDTDLKEALAVKGQIESRVIRFVLDTTGLAAGQIDEVDSISADVRKLFQLARAAGKRIQVTVIGHTDQLGTEDTNLLLSRQRAEVVRALLDGKIGDLVQPTAVGAGTKDPVRPELTDEDKEANRSATVRITLIDAS